MHILNKYALINLFLHNIIVKRSAYAYLTYKTYLIKRLKAQLLLNTDVLDSE